MAAKVTEILKWVSPPVKRQIQYQCDFSRNITSLRDEANQLEDTAHDLQLRVDGAENDSRVIYREVKTWLQDSKNIKDEIQGILNEVPNLESHYLKLRSRFLLSRKAKKTTDRVKELIILGQSMLHADVISNPRTAAATREIPSRMTYDFDSRKKIEEEIMTTLRDGDVNMMAIYGMGGLGKTTMAIRIMNRALKEHVFDEIVMAVVSQQVDKLKIQLEIGGTLGLRLQEETSQARLEKLHARLKNTRKTLLVLDDVWEELVPEDLGIPSGCRECTILLTSRNRNVLRRMHVQKIFGMEVLSAEDSWIMFRDRVGTCVDNPELNSIAKEVVNECKGLPLAITTLGAALTCEMDMVIWKNSLCGMRRSDPAAIQEFSKEVYNPLKISYDALETDQCKFVFLLCCLYPEDDDIPLEQLTYFCMGLRLLEGDIGNVEEARNRMHALTKVLKDRSLLLDSLNEDDHVRMHDVVRDFCIFIAKQERYIGDQDNRTWISSSHRSELPMGLVVSNLRLLFFRAHNYAETTNFTLDNNFLQGIRDLSVICIERYSLVSLPHTTQNLRNLNTLVLDWCERVETLSVVWELENLEILICRHCDSIEELPPKITALKKLKVLELTSCGNLKRIGRGIISSLEGLEELKMLESFNKWEGEDREERENAGLRELGELTNLRCLEIEIEDLEVAAENIRLSSKIDRFTINFCLRNLCDDDYYYSATKQMRLEWEDTTSFKKQMRLKWEGAPSLGDWIKMLLLRDIECLLLVGKGANEVGSLINLEKIKSLVLGACESMMNVVTISMDDTGGATVFPSLEHLKLFELPKLEEVWNHQVSLNCFQILKKLILNDLPALKQLWKSSQNDLGDYFLPQLEVLEIVRCEMMEAVFLWKGEEGNESNSCRHITKRFPKLKELDLHELPNLISFCHGIEGIKFPELASMAITGCGKMKGMVANGVTSNDNNSGASSSNAADTIHLFCESQQVSFGCLKELKTDWNPFCSHTIHVPLLNGLEELEIIACSGSRSLFTSSLVENLVNLEKLHIKYCDEMVEVIKDDEERSMSGGRQKARLFPKLGVLRLYDLHKLVSFCEWKCDVELPSLTNVVIIGCDNMKSCTKGPLITPKLKSVDTYKEKFGDVKDLNEWLKKQYLRRVEEQEEEDQPRIKRRKQN